MLSGAVFWYVLVIVHCLKTHSDLYGCTVTVSATLDWQLDGEEHSSHVTHMIRHQRC
jgi:hypothetical protein